MLKDIHTHHFFSSSESQLLSCCYKDADADEVRRAVHLSVGIHPWYLTEEDYPLQQRWVERMLADPRVRALGEGGLDKFCTTPYELQERSFRWLIEQAEIHRLPLIIHCVKSTAELIRLKKEYNPHSPWIIHGFRGKPQQAGEYIRHGFYLSFGERYAEESLRKAYPSHFFMETDESQIHIDMLYQRAAQILQIPLEKLEESVFENINNVF